MRTHELNRFNSNKTTVYDHLLRSDRNAYQVFNSLTDKKQQSKFIDD